MKIFLAFVLGALGCLVAVTCVLACLFFGRAELREYQQSVEAQAYAQASYDATVRYARQQVADGCMTEKEFHECLPHAELHPITKGAN
jgi:hypothetical protein